MARTRLAPPQSAVVKTADEIRADIAKLPDVEKAQAEAAFEEAARQQVERQEKYDRELT